MSALVFNYFDDWKGRHFACPRCGWRGLGSQLSLCDVWKSCTSHVCPSCAEFMAEVTNPTVTEARSNWDQCSEGLQKTVQVMELLSAQFEREKLQETTCLPDIPERFFTLSWDTIEKPNFESTTYILYGDQVIAQEPAVYEGYRRYIEVAELLKRRYGVALRDLVPTSRSELYLYGDCYSALNVVPAARERIFDFRFGNAADAYSSTEERS